jgi:Restriction Endonuclease associating with ARP
MSYERNAVYSHLAEYKKRRLGVAEDGSWRGRKYGHILPRRDHLPNLIDAGYFADLKKIVVDSSSKLHQGFHHLNSSQALAFNFFVPLVKENRLPHLLSLMGVRDGISEYHFEYVKDPAEGTNFDFFMRGERGSYCFEVKYSENTFGSAKADDTHIEKFEQIYRPLLDMTCDVDKKEFFDRYQLWRNICYSADCLVTFVLPRFRKDLADKIQNALTRARYPHNIKMLYIDDVVVPYVVSNHERLSEHYKEFAEKYLNIEGI